MHQIGGHISIGLSSKRSLAMHHIDVWPSMMHGDLFPLKPIWCVAQFDAWPYIMDDNLFALKPY